MNKVKSALLVLFLGYLLSVESKFATQHEKALLNEFKKNYHKDLIPLVARKSGDDKMVIRMSIALESIVEVNEKGLIFFLLFFKIMFVDVKICGILSCTSWLLLKIFVVHPPQYS